MWEQPSDEVLHAFGIGVAPERLAGGQGSSWLAGDLVLKPGGGIVHAWLAQVLAGLEPVDLRLATPVRPLRGSWEFRGWTATKWVEGHAPDYADTRSWHEVLDAGRAFNRSVRHLSRPDCLDSRTDVWAIADRATWDEVGIELRPEAADLGRRLRRALAPLGRPQVVHGDLTTNVLCADGLPPAVIDVSPYWRPPAFAEGIVLADALMWHGASAELVTRAEVPVTAVVRGLLFRLTTSSLIADRRSASSTLEVEVACVDRVARSLGV